MGSVGLEEDFHWTRDSAERVGSGGGVAGLVDDVVGEFKAEEKDWYFSLEIQLVEGIVFRLKDLASSKTQVKIQLVKRLNLRFKE